MKPVTFDAEAAEELDAAARWYDEQQPGIGAALVEAVREASRRVAEMPSAHGLAPAVPEQLGVRHRPVRRFPYALVFVELADEIRVLAVAHDRRRPGYWMERGRTR